MFYVSMSDLLFTNAAFRRLNSSQCIDYFWMSVNAALECDCFTARVLLTERFGLLPPSFD